MEIPMRKTYTEQEAMDASIEYFSGDEMAAGVWLKKYALRDKNGNIYEKTPEQMHRRIASELARVDSLYKNPKDEEFYYDLLKNFKYVVPQGSPMFGIGNTYQTVSLSNCIVVDNPKGSRDSYGAILKTDQELAQLMKRRAGVGASLDGIRPKDSIVQNSAMTSTGVVPFMERYSNTTREVAQQNRRGALMLAITINHPDSEDFIDAKMVNGKVTGANISVKITDSFMRVVDGTTAAMVDRFNELSNKGDEITEAEKKELDSLDQKIGYTQSFTYSDGSVMKKRVVAKTIWDKIIFNAWKSAEPGVLFFDKILSESPADCYADLGFETVGTNPCGEIPLPDGDSCRLSLLNLYSYVNNPFTPYAKFDYDLFKTHAKHITRIMDNIVDLEIEKIEAIIHKIKTDPEDIIIKRAELDVWERILKRCVDGRRTGIGVTAEGDMLAALGYRYGTPEATDLLENIHMNYAGAVIDASIDLASERGAFPIWDINRETENPFLNRVYDSFPELREKVKIHGRRNIANLTIAPAGSVSILTQTTSGIEPVFSVSYTRRRKINPQEKNTRVDFVDEVGDSWTEYNVFHHKFNDWFYINRKQLEPDIDLDNFDDAKEYLNHLSQEKVDDLIKMSPYYKAMANDVDWVEKVKMQGSIQKWIDHSISVTVNLPQDVDTDLVNQVYMTGWKSGCKGMTIYRDGSRSGVLITKDDKKKEQIKEMFRDNHAPKRNKRLDCDVIDFMNKGEKWICFVGLLEDRPYEIFTGPKESFPNIPGNVNRGIIERRKDTSGSRYIFMYPDKNGNLVESGDLKLSVDTMFADISKIVSAILRHAMPLEYVVDLLNNLKLDGDLITTWKSGVTRIIKRYVKNGQKGKGKCEDCGSNELAYQDGCMVCMSCGSTKCS